MENTDPKPYLYYFNGESTTLINAFFTKVKPIEGIVKYKMVNWENFPKSQEEAKKLSLEWVNMFKSNNLYSGLKVLIFFHLEKKTIRFELKKDNTKVFDINKDLQVFDTIESFNYENNQSVIFSCIQTDFFNDLDINKCKDLGKTIYQNLELK